MMKMIIQTILKITTKKKPKKPKIRKNSLINHQKILSSNQCQKILMMNTLNGTIRKEEIIITKNKEEDIDLEEIEELEETEDTGAEEEVTEAVIEEEIGKTEGSFKEEIETIKIICTKKRMSNDYFNFRNIFKQVLVWLGKY